MGLLEMNKHANSGSFLSTYDRKYCEAVDEYIGKCQDHYQEFHKTRGDKSDTYERQIVVKLPSHERFAQYIGVNRDVLYDWKNKHPEFKLALDRISAEQKARLMDNGLSGTYNSTIAKLILSVNHNMNEKTESEVTHRMPQPILDVSKDNSYQENPSLG